MTDGVRRLSHEDAEMLISARMDDQLDRADSRALLVHLQTCESCRAFAVQSEVLGRELSALPVLPPSALVDRQIRETIGKGRSRWSLAALMPATGGNSGLRLAVGALAMLTLVSVFLLVRLAGDQSGEGPSIEAPNGGVAQQLDRTPTDEPVMLGETSGPTETARVVVPKTPVPGSTEVGAPTEAGDVPTETSAAAAAAQLEETPEAQVEPTRTLDPNFVYSADQSRTPESVSEQPTSTQETGEPDPSEESGDVSVAAALVDEGTPVDSADATVAPESETPVATEAPETPTRDEAAEPTETPVAPTQEPTSEATQTPERPTEEPATEEPATEEPATDVPEPTETPTPIEISVDATEAPAEPTTPPPAGETSETIEVESPESSATPNDMLSGPDPTETPQPPAPTETPVALLGQPTIAPISGQTGGEQGTGEVPEADETESPPIVPNDGAEFEDDGSGIDDEGGQGIGAAGTEAQNPEDTGQGAGPEGDSGSSPPIVPSDGTNVPDGVGGNGQGGDTQQPPAVPTVDESLEPSGLDLSDVVTSLPSGTSSPLGRLEFSPGMNLYVVIAPDGQLAVADLEGQLVVTLGPGDLPVWSGSGLMFSTSGEAGAQVGIWNSDSGELSYIPASESEASDDVPIGGDGTAFYYLRIYPGSGIVELRSATIAGSDNGVIWTSDSVTLGGARPLYSDSGVYLPTDSEWLFIDWAGNESSLGANPYGYVGAPILSPGGSLMAYSAGNEVIVAWTDSPGSAVSTAPYSGPGGYAFATSGEEIVVSDGSSLHVITYDGQDLGTLGGSQPIGGVYWISDTIYYLQIGEDAALMATSLAAIQSE
jgi:hypothetical protein